MLLRTLIIFLFTNSLLAQEKFTLKQDLRQRWMTYENDSYVHLGEKGIAGTNTIYFAIDLEEFPEDLLEIESTETFFLFVNAKLIREHRGTIIIPLDSLARTVQSNSLLFSIYQPQLNERDLHTGIVTDRPLAALPAGDLLKPDSSFKDFVILSGLMLITLFVVMIRLHPKLASDYFSVTGVFSLREGDDAQSGARFAGSSNIIFYIFSCLLLGFFFMIVFQYLPDRFTLSLNFKAVGFWSTLWQWIKLSALLMALLLAKLLIVFTLSNLFGMKGLASIHFFNWVRLLLIVCASISVVLFVYYISNGSYPVFYVVLLTLLVIVLAVWIIIALLKFNARIEHSMFHLFSYICATEIIPLLVTVKVLFY